MTQRGITIQMTGEMEAGKTLLLLRIKRMLEDECGNYTMEINTDNHRAFLTLCDNDRVVLASKK